MNARRNDSRDRKPRSPRAEEPGPRRQARACAVQMLYALDARKSESPRDVDKMVRDLWLHLDAPVEARPYGEELIRGAVQERERVDNAIREVSANWRLERMGMVDRNVLRLATYEIIARTDVPVPVVINEALEIARTFGSAESVAFVNGMLDKLARAHKRL